MPINLDALYNPFPELTTSRLRLRQIRPDDVDDLHAILSDEAVTQPYGVETFSTRREAKERILTIQRHYRARQALRWAITCRDAGRLIGACGFVAWKRKFCHAAIGYELAPAYWRRGIMTEALTAVLDFGFKRLDLNRIEALVKPDNEASLGLLRKLGFREEGLLRQYGYWHGRYHDLAIYSILKSEWRTIND